MVGERLSGLLSWERVLLSRAVTQLSAGASADSKPMLMEAGIALDTVLQKFPSSADATIVLAQFYQRFGFHKDAIRSWNRCMKLDPLSSGMALSDGANSRKDISMLLPIIFKKLSNTMLASALCDSAWRIAPECRASGRSGSCFRNRHQVSWTIDGRLLASWAGFPAVATL